ncbi:MAG: hypothetical protein SVX43_07460 [Cyanobacteriota bacterium]|nr:hypothetical protein [Cyanobacteriota bacterium]
MIRHSLSKGSNLSNVSVKLWLLLQKKNGLASIPLLRECLTSALVIAGSLVAMPSVLAQPAPPSSVDVRFSGVVQGVCNFSTPIPGALAAKGSDFLDSQAPGGAAGQVTVTCNRPARLTISDPIQTGGPPVPVIKGASFVSSSNGPSGSSSIPLSPGQSQLAVDMFVDSATPLPPGNYDYSVTLTVTP